MVLAFAAMENFPFEETWTVAEIRADLFRDINQVDILAHLFESSLDDCFILDWIERAG